MGNTPLRPGVRLPNVEEEKKMQALRDQIDQVILHDQMISQSETVLVAFTDMLKAVSESSIKEAEKLKILNEYIQANLGKEGSEKEDAQDDQGNSGVFASNSGWLKSEEFRQFLIGTALGGSLSMIMVIYLNMSPTKGNP